MGLTGKEKVRLFGQFAETECNTQDIANLATSGSGSSLSANGVTSNGSLGTFPANGYVLYALFRETSNNAATAAIGTTSGGSDVLSAQPVSGNGTLTVAITAFSKAWFSATQTQSLFLTVTGGTINGQLVFQAVGP